MPTDPGRAATPSPDSSPAVPGSPPEELGDLAGLRHSTLTWVRLAAVLITIFLAYQLFVVVRGLVAAVISVMLCVLVAAVISFLGSPLVELLQARLHIPRSLAVLLTMALGVGAVAMLIWLASGPLVAEGHGLALRTPHLVHRLDSWVTRAEAQLRTHGIRVDAVGFISSKLASVVPQLTGLVVSGVTGALGVVVDVVVALVLAFWVMRDGGELRSRLVGLFPTRVGGELNFAIDAFTVVVGGYVRAQLLMSVLVAAMAGIGTALLGVPFPLVVAIAAGVFELVPLVGPFVGGAVALLLAFTKSPTLALFTLILFLGIHVVEGYLLTPRIQARFVQLHPLVTILALFAGVDAAGFLGALVAVPAASYLTVLVRAGVGDWRAQRPDLFAHRRVDTAEELRNRRLLGSFRLFKKRPQAAPPHSKPPA